MLKGVPISILSRSKEFIEVIYECISKWLSEDSHLFIADFAAGENDEVPLYFQKTIKNELEKRSFNADFFVYCTDLHTLRIESLFDKLQDQDLHKNTRVVLAKFETMIEEASFPEIQETYLKESRNHNKLDESIQNNRFIPEESFHLGVLNNDVIGYIYEYYKEYTDARASLRGIRNVMKEDGLLIVTQPGLLYPVNNIEELENHGFKYLLGIDFDLNQETSKSLEKEFSPSKLSRLNHYTILLFRCIKFNQSHSSEKKTIQATTSSR